LAGAVIAGQAIALPSLGVLVWSAGFVLAAVLLLYRLLAAEHRDGGTAISTRLRAID
jgi:hypothetical protein